MTDGADLLATILAEPAEDLHRLKYADWLQEHGEDERAEFIRVGCEAVRWGCTFAQTKEQPGWKHNCGTNERGYWLCTNPRLREQELWDAHAQDWFPLLDKFKMGRTERGFVAELTCTAADWLAHGDAIRAAHPVERVRLTTLPGRMHRGLGDLILYAGDVQRQTAITWVSGEVLTIEGVLAAEWPSVAFEMPPA